MKQAEAYRWSLLFLLLFFLLSYVPAGISDDKLESAHFLTKEEQIWISKNPILRIAPAPNFPPIEFFDEHGQYRGVTADFFKLITQKTGLKFQIEQLESWAHVVEKTKRQEIDLWGEAAQTEERKQYMRFTSPYLSFPDAIINRQGETKNLTMTALSNLSVVGIDGYASHAHLQKITPALQLITVPNIETGLKMVSSGLADTIIVSMASASYYIQKLGLSNLQLSGESKFHWSLSFASRKDWPLLHSILQKTLDNISPTEKEQIIKKWVSLDKQAFIAKRSFWITIALITAIAGLSLVMVLLWNLSLRKMVNKKTIELQNELERRKGAEEAVSHSEERLNNFFDASFEGLFFHDDGKILDINPATTQIFGYKKKELLNHNLLEFVTPDCRQNVIALMASNEPGSYETMVTKSDGESVPVSVRARTIETEKRKIRIVSLSDISKHKQAEEALKKAYDNLDHIVIMRTSELEKANERLTELDQLKSMFIASMSHELRTPLNSIIGFTGIILDGISGDINAQQRDQLDRVYNSSKHLLALITDIIDISKIEAGHIDVYPESFVLDELINEALQTIQPQREKKGLALHTNIPPDIQMHTDKKRLLQCLLNYLSNAVKYTEHGKIEIEIEDLGDEVKIIVRDSGIGINKEARGRLFQAFERIDTHLRIKTPGTGLGLYLCKKITTELLDGSVAVESKVMEGSTFSLKIPKRLNRKKSRPYFNLDTA